MRRSRIGEIQDRFWQRVERRGEDDCWIWKGTLNNRGGYGVIGGALFGVRHVPTGAGMLAHRASWIIHNGPFPGDQSGWHGWVVMHKCDNPRCVNPKHLELGTQKNNVQDMDRKERRVVSVKRATAHPNAKLTDGQVRNIMASEKPNSILAAELGVGVWLVKAVRSGKTYSALTGGERVLRGREHLSGDKSPSASLTYEQVRFIRTTDKSAAEMAVVLGVTKTTVVRARSGVTYSDIDIPCPAVRVGRRKKT